MAPADDFRMFRFAAYNFGGVIFNLMLTAVFFVLFWFAPDNYALSAWQGAFLVSAVLNLLLALQNLLPIRSFTNDGANVREAMKSIDATRGLFMMFHANNLLMQGVRYRDMSEDLFEVNKNADRSNYLVAYMFVLKATRLDDKGQHGEAFEIYTSLDLGKLPAIYQYLVKTNLIHHHLIYTPSTSAAVKELYKDKGLQEFIRFNEVATYAAYTFFVENKKDEGRKILEKSKKALVNTPNKGERIMSAEQIKKIETLMQAAEENIDDTIN